MADPTQPAMDEEPEEDQNLVEQLWRGRVQVRLRRNGRAAGWLTLQISRGGDDLLIEWEPVRGDPSSRQIPRAQMAAWLRSGSDREPLVTGAVEWFSDIELRVCIDGMRHDSLPVEALPALLSVAVR